MPDWDRDTLWRQGHVLTEGAAAALGLAETPNQIVVVISHDCDLAQAPEQDPRVEVIVGRRITKEDGNFTYGKTPRRLHVPFNDGTQQVVVELSAGAKSELGKAELAAYRPDENIALSPAERDTLQSWLAARYRRSALPDEFEDRLRRTKVRDRLLKIGAQLGKHVRAIYFDIDGGQDLVKAGADDVYELAIYLLYSTEDDSEAAEKAAIEMAKQFEQAFRDHCYDGTKKAWRDIELTYCDAISDEAMTIRQASHLQRWNLDYLSLRSGDATSAD